MDVHHPCAVQVSKYCTIGTNKKTLKHFLYVEYFILYTFMLFCWGERDIFQCIV